LVVTPQAAHATVTTITPSSADTFLTSGDPGVNYGTSTALRIISGAGVQPDRIVVKFVLSSIPSGSTINTASLQLYYYDRVVGDPVGRTYTANRVTTDWVEGTCNGCNPPPLGATWTTTDGTTNWGTAGGDFTATGAASQTVAATFGYITWDVTTIVKAWIEGGQPNYGFLIKDLNENVGGFTDAWFYAREQGSSMPILTVDYTGPAGAPVGGVVMPANTLALVAPWFAVIGLVACIATVFVVAKKRRA